MRIFAVAEIVALGVWLGALVAFAFVFAPVAFHLIAPLDVTRFATLIVRTLALLTKWGYILGAVAFIGAVAGRAPLRAVLVAVALAFAFYHQHVVVQAMLAITDVASPAYHALHTRSTEIYGAVVVLVFASLLLAITAANALRSAASFSLRRQ